MQGGTNHKCWNWRWGMVWGLVLLAFATGSVSATAADRVGPFAVALERRDLATARELLEGEFDPDRTDRSGRTMLMHAARHDRAPPEFVKILIGKGANVALADSERFSAIRHAAWAGSLEKVKILAEAGAPIGEAGREAERHGFYEITDYLNQPEVRQREALQRALHSATQAGDLPAVMGLLTAGARATVVNEAGHSAVSLAALGTSGPLLELLLDVAEQEQPGRPLPGLRAAAARGASSVMEVLLSRGAPVAGESRGEPPLIAAVRHGHEQAFETLLRHGADVNSEWQGATALAWAENTLRDQLAARLQEFGGESRGLDRLDNPLAEAHTIERVRDLLAAGANPNEVRSGKNTPLQTAVRRCNPEIVRVLLEAGADPNESGKGYLQDPPLFQVVGRAFSCGSVFGDQIAELLLKHGANPNARNQRGDSPLALARQGGPASQTLVEILLSHGATDEPNGGK